MKKIIPGICVALLLLVGSCSKRNIHSGAKYSLAKDTTNHLGIEKYTLVVSVKGDSVYVAVPYKPYPIERVLEKSMAFSIAAIIVFALAEQNKD